MINGANHPWHLFRHTRADVLVFTSCLWSATPIESIYFTLTRVRHPDSDPIHRVSLCSCREGTRVAAAHLTGRARPGRGRRGPVRRRFRAFAFPPRLHTERAAARCKLYSPARERDQPTLQATRAFPQSDNVL